jgi:hypothetical protein
MRARHGILDNEIFIENATRSRERDFPTPGLSAAESLAS